MSVKNNKKKKHHNNSKMLFYTSPNKILSRKLFVFLSPNFHVFIMLKQRRGKIMSAVSAGNKI